LTNMKSIWMSEFIIKALKSIKLNKNKLKSSHKKEVKILGDSPHAYYYTSTLNCCNIIQEQNTECWGYTPRRNLG